MPPGDDATAEAADPLTPRPPPPLHAVLPTLPCLTSLHLSPWWCDAASVEAALQSSGLQVQRTGAAAAWV
jgi:hypothetical protein